MKLSSLLLLCVFSLPALSFAQPGSPHSTRHFTDYIEQKQLSSLSVFSEPGTQFFLVLNGIKQNDVPVLKIRVEGLPKFATDIEIIFVDKSMPAIRKRIIVADPVSVFAVDMTLKILSGLETYPVLRFYKCTEVEHDYHPQRDEYVMHYGKPEQIVR